MQTIGDKIRILREIRGFTQDYVSSQLGVSQRAYSKLERGDTDLPYTRLEHLAQIFQVNVAHLVALKVFPVADELIEAQLNRSEETMLQVYVDQINHLKQEIYFLRRQIEILTRYIPEK